MEEINATALRQDLTEWIKASFEKNKFEEQNFNVSIYNKEEIDSAIIKLKSLGYNASIEDYTSSKGIKNSNNSLKVTKV